MENNNNNKSEISHAICLTREVYWKKGERRGRKADREGDRVGQRLVSGEQEWGGREAGVERVKTLAVGKAAFLQGNAVNVHRGVLSGCS